MCSSDLQEAGGIVTDIDGTDGYLETGNIVAGTVKIYEAMLKILNEKNS